ncbi:PAS domain S-box protein [Desulfovibrio ferrophilus]|uniref:Diguanylate cyclase/phosphodiesterase with PAS/PAC sensor(S) n=1 Tax=Desulfovibrio ferrophilus TaxID=241368 RepID=A0A2Z6AU72_9BACT|nr:PAS domain S-box protein [Desulfovibrio ferrophilus]BBD06770.1 diguanylate cyclase/phosphodiesterase with PAS/PAC sensor(S) [Desulfovibrio ferrophilus]
MTNALSDHRFFKRLLNILLVALLCFAATFGLMEFILSPRTLHLNAAEKNFIAHKKHLRVGIDNDFQPLQFVDTDNRVMGMTVDYLRLLALHTGLELTFVPAAWVDIVEMLKRGEVDMIPDATPTPSRMKHFLFTQAVNNHSTSLYVLSHIQGVHSPADLAGRRVAVVQGTSIIDEILKYPEVIVVPYRGTIDQLRALKNKEVDAAVSYDMLSRFWLSKENITNIKAVGTIKSEPGCLAVRKDDALLHSILSKAVESMPRDEVLRIEQKWVGTPTMERNFPSQIRHYQKWISAIVAIVFSIFLWNILLQRRVKNQVQILDASHKRYQALFDTAQDMILILKDRIIVDVNQKAIDRLGYSRDEIIGMTPKLLGPPRQPSGISSEQLALDSLKRAQAGESFTIEWQAVSASGALLDTEVSLSTFESPEGRYVLGIARDITQWKQNQQETQRQAAYFQQLFENSPQGVVMTDDEALIVGVNRAFEKLFGWSEEEARGHYVHELLLPPEDHEQNIRNAYRIRAGEWLQTEGSRLHKDGHAIQTAALGYPIFVDDKFHGAYVIYTDITQRKQAEQEILQQKAFFEQLFENSPQAIVMLNLDAEITKINAAFTAIFGFTEDETIGMTTDQILVPEREMTVHKQRAAALRQGKTVQYEIARRRKDGQLIQVNIIAYPILIEEEIKGAYVVYNDISDRRRAEQESQRQTAYFQQLYENSPQGIAIVDNDERIQSTNKGFETIFGYNSDQTTGVALNEIIAPPDATDAMEISTRLARGEFIITETVRQHKDGSSVDVALIAYPILIDGQRQGSYAIYTDITERKKAERQLIHQAYHDKLTGLPNRSMLQERIGHAMERAKRDKSYNFQLLYMGLDRFKVVNDSLGHVVGDQLIMATAHRLVDTMRGVDTICRVGGDEFAILLEEDVSADSALTATQRLQASIRRPINTGEQEIHITASIGVIMGPPGHERPDFMLRDAEIALHQAKQKGADHVEVFQASMHDRAVQLQQLETDLRQAVEKQEFYLHYQPIADLRTGILTGVEALARWKHPERGKIYPGEFIPVAEDTGLIIPLGEFALREACRQFKDWQQAYPGCPLGFVSVNLSARQFTQPDLANKIQDILEETALAPAHLHLEITETVVMENAHIANSTLAALKTIGCRLSVDDFGTGYSSLAYLHGFPLDTLKVDRSFVNRISQGKEHVEIIKTIIKLAHNLGLDVIAEGVEDQDQADQLRRLRCDFVQGYLYSRPVSAKSIEVLLAVSGASLLDSSSS